MNHADSHLSAAADGISNLLIVSLCYKVHLEPVSAFHRINDYRRRLSFRQKSIALPCVSLTLADTHLDSSWKLHSWTGNNELERSLLYLASVDDRNVRFAFMLCFCSLRSGSLH